MLTTFFFFNDTATTEIYTLSLHDALPICAVLELGCDQALSDQRLGGAEIVQHVQGRRVECGRARLLAEIGKSTRLNSSHANISYAVFCLKKKKTPLNSCTPSVHL